MKACSVPTASWTFGSGTVMKSSWPFQQTSMTWLALALVGVGVELLELFHELLMVDAEEHAVDGLELERIVVVVPRPQRARSGRDSARYSSGVLPFFCSS